jgi:hypothetical protein
VRKRYTKEQLVSLPRLPISMAAFFFDVTVSAFKHYEYKGYLTNEDGTPIIATRSSGGQRMYSLNDVRECAHALRRGEHLTNAQFNVIISRIDAFSTPVKKATGGHKKGGIVYNNKNLVGHIENTRSKKQ